VQRGDADLLICEAIVWGTQFMGRALPVPPAISLSVQPNERLNDQRLLAKAEALESFRGSATAAVEYEPKVLHTLSATFTCSVTSLVSPVGA
jgi:hypothetical protein